MTTTVELRVRVQVPDGTDPRSVAESIDGELSDARQSWSRTPPGWVVDLAQVMAWWQGDPAVDLDADEYTLLPSRGRYEGSVRHEHSYMDKTKRHSHERGDIRHGFDGQAEDGSDLHTGREVWVS